MPLMIRFLLILFAFLTLSHKALAHELEDTILDSGSVDLSQAKQERTSEKRLALSSEEISYLDSLKTLRVPLIDHQPPLSFIDKGKAAGYLNELFEHVANALGISYELISGFSYSESLQALKEGQVDFLNDYSDFGDERDYLLHTKPVLTTPFVAVGRAKSGETIRSLNDLEGKRLILVAGFQQTRIIQERYPHLDFILTDGIDKAYQRLRSKDADYYIDNATHAGYYLRSRMVNDLHISGELPASEIGLLTLRFAVPADAPLLLSAVEKVLDNIDRQKLLAMRENWLLPASGERSIELTDAQLTWLEKHPVIRVAVDPNWAPVEYRDDQGQYRGISIDYLKQLEEMLPVRFEIAEGLSWDEAVAGIKNKQLDIFSSVSKTPQRETFASFTQPYLSMPIRIFARDDISYIGGIENLAGKNVAVVDNYAIADWLENDFPNLSLKKVSSPATGLELVSSGEVDAFIGNMVIVNYYLGKLGIVNVRVSGDTPYSNDQSMAVRNDWPILAEILNKSLQNISTEDRELIFNRWMSIKFEREINYQVIWQISISALLIIFIILYWNRRLSLEVDTRKIAEHELRNYQSTLENRVKERTSELQATNEVLQSEITERKLTEQALQRSEEDYRLLVENQSDLVVKVDNEGRFEFVSPSYCKMFGISEEELLGKAFMPLVHEDDRELTAKAISTLESPPHTAYMEQRAFTKDGWRWLGWNDTAVLDEQGNIKSIIGVGRDIHDRKLAEEKLHQAAAVFASTAEGVIITDLIGTIIDINEAFSDITLYSKDDVVGQNASILQSGRHDHCFFTGMWEKLQRDGHWRGEIWNRKRDGAVYPELLTINAVTDKDNTPTGYVGVFADITALKETEERLAHLAQHDPLTNLPNRLLLDERINQSIRRASRENALLGVIFVDLDRFKHVNDSLGHTAGDNLLRDLAQRLDSAVRADDTVARISGDEFVIVVENISNPEDAMAAADKLLECFNSPFVIAGTEITLSASMGISLYPEDGKDSTTLLSNADAAMYRAKDDGRSNYQFYTSELTSAAFEHVFLENALRGALARNEFYLVYQPQVDLKTGCILGFEVLLRWQHPTRGLISPAKFIPIAEQSGLIWEIGAWVLNTACLHCKDLFEKGFDLKRLAVNVAGPQIRNPNFVELIRKTLQDTKFPARYLELELTESFVMKNQEKSIESIEKVRQLGVNIAIDDFGTGYSSLSHLKKLPIDKLKIDQSFVADVPDDANDKAIVEAIIAMANALSMGVIAEGIETEAQKSFLIAKGCSEGQGFLFGKPQRIEDIISLFSSDLQIEKTLEMN